MCTVNSQYSSIKLLPNLLDYGTSRMLMFSGIKLGKWSNPKLHQFLCSHYKSPSFESMHQTNPFLVFLVSFPFGSHWLCFETSVLWNLKCPVILWFFLIKKASGFKAWLIQGINLLHTPNKSFHSYSSTETGDAAFTLSWTLSMDSSWMQPES